MIVSSFLRFESVTFRYTGSPRAAVRDVSFTTEPGWIVLAGANGSGKTTLLKLATGFLRPDTGVVEASGDALYCPQRTDRPPKGFRQLVRQGLFAELLAKLEIDWDWPDRWQTLSHGERKRSQLAVALARNPDILAVDEPVNHLDSRGREMIHGALQSYSGIGLLVSHDRILMDSLASRCGIMHSDGLVVRRGGYTVAKREDDRELKAKRAARSRAAAKLDQLRRDARHKELTARTLQARSSGRRLTYKEICTYNVDGPSRVDSSVQKAGKLSRTARARVARAREEMESITYRRVHRTGIVMEGERCQRNLLLELPGDNIRVGSTPLEYPRLTVLPGDRIALTGPNGSGKSTLIEFIVGELHLPEGRLLYIPQELTADQSCRALSQVIELDNEMLGQAMICVRRLGSDPRALLDSHSPSPGETRKLLLCLGILDRPWLVIMDEPTNHLDLPGIECLEEALKGLCCALLLVSHDRRFLGNTTDIRWKLETEPAGTKLVVRA
ncbi:ATP-binding cassette domain-containing protein [Candidatus Fermentibacteria bacterium]|nr:ATP-binding cassette domain-containing protein [Candidatus Fermentibacteria bacterium]